jgi:DNA repair exonuclease SbcCD ATPase subunit
MSLTRTIPQIDSIAESIARIQGRREVAAKNLSRLDTDILKLEAREKTLDKCAEAFRSLIDDEIKGGVSVVEELLSKGLQQVFDDQDLSVRAEVDVQRGKVSVQLLTVHSDGGRVIEGDPLDTFGGSLMAVQSLLLRIIVMQQRKLRPLLLVDESFSAFDSNYVNNMGMFLDTLCRRIGLDLLVVTHSSALFESAPRAFRITKKAGAATFTQVK